jgi:2-keto-3-deoxy-L-fuconate dehydrogenase
MSTAPPNPSPTTTLPDVLPAARLQGQRILLTQADQFMGPALQRRFEAEGAEVIADVQPLADAPDLPRALVAAAGHIDTLVLHLALPAPATAAADITEAEWRSVFAHLVDPLPRLVAAVLPQMLARGAGRILLMGSAAALRGQKRTGSYSAARGAQLAYMQSVALELAPHGIAFNAIAQNFVDNPTYFPAAVQANPRFQDRLAREVPLGRLVSADEDAAFAAYLCSEAAACFVGQTFPVSGGWALR